MAHGTVIYPAVVAFNAKADKEQIKKIGEEYCELYAEWQKIDKGETDKIDALVDEAADVIQALTNFLAAYGVENMGQAMYDCYRRNKARGRVK